jgi:hypothetical protein
MKYFLSLLIVPILSCANIDSDSGSKVTLDSANGIHSNSKPSTTSQDTTNLVFSTDLQIKMKALIGLWNLKGLHMIDKKGTRTEFQQASTTIEFTGDHKMISKVGQIVAESHWDYDNSINRLTTILKKINGNNTESKVTQENKIIYLTSSKLIYQYNDPVTGYILEMQYGK